MPDPGVRLTEVEVEVKAIAAAITGAADDSLKSILESAKKIVEAMNKKIGEELKKSADLKAQVTPGKTITHTHDVVEQSEVKVRKLKR